MKTKVKAVFAAFLAVTMMSCFCSCEKETSDTVMKVYGHKVSSDEYRYYWNNYKKSYPDLSFSETKDKCEEALCNVYALYALADDVGFKMSDDERKTIESDYEEGKAMYEDEDSFKNALEAANMTDGVYRNILTVQTLEESLRKYMADESNNAIPLDDATVENDINTNFIRIKQIFISNDDGDSKEENLKLAKDILVRLKAGISFDELRKQYSEDEEQPDEGYCFTKGQMREEIEYTSNSLTEYGISEVVEAEDGYFIIERLPLTEVYINDNFETLRYYYSCRVFNEKRARLAEDIKIEYLPEFSDLGLN